MVQLRFASAAAGAGRPETLLRIFKQMLPSTPSEFRSPAYWRSFFAARKGATFEWYGSAAQLLPVLAPAVPPAAASRALVVGCGNSALSEDLWAAGYKSTLSIDFDAGVVDEMRRKVGAGCPGLEWAVADATSALLQGRPRPRASQALRSLNSNRVSMKPRTNR